MESSTMKEAFEEIQRLSDDPETRRIAEYRDSQLRGQLQREYDARKEGKEEGERKGAAGLSRHIVLNMHAKQTPAAVIAELTGIALDDVLRIIEMS